MADGRKLPWSTGSAIGHGAASSATGQWGCATGERRNCAGDLVCTSVGRSSAEGEQSGRVLGRCALDGSRKGKEEHRIVFCFGKCRTCSRKGESTRLDRHVRQSMGWGSNLEKSELGKHGASDAEMGTPDQGDEWDSEEDQFLLWKREVA